MTTHRTILLTGASGVVGRALLSTLRHHRVVCLTHRNRPDHHGEHVRGDVSAAGLGLDTQTRQRLTRDVDLVIHCAAITDFGAGEQATNEMNVLGTRNVLEFAGQAHASLHYLSTAFVARDDGGRVDVGDAGADPSVYIASKRAAEQLVRDSGIPATIVRPSVVIGDSQTGATAKFQGLLVLATAVLKSALPLVPLRADVGVDFIPQDMLARAVTALVDTDRTGGEYWITAGQAALGAGHLMDLVTDTGTRCGVEFSAPRLVDPEMVDRLVRPVFIAPLPKPVRRRFDDVMAMTALFANATPFPCTISDIPGCEAMTGVELAAAFTRSVEYLVHAKGLAAAARVAA